MISAAFPQPMSKFASFRKINSEKKAQGKSPTNNKLLNHLLAGNWDLALDRLKRKPDDIQARHLFLHVALRNKSPLNVVKALHEARPEQVYHRDQERKMMALHIACQRGLPLPVVQFLHEKFPDAVRETCSEGMLPLHLACVSHACRIPVICYLLSVHPEAMSIQDSKGLIPLTYIEHSGHPHSQKLFYEFERGVAFWGAKPLRGPVEGCKLSLLICERKWDQVLERLMKNPEEVTIWTVYKEKRLLPIHYAIKYKAPLTVISELSEVHPYGLALCSQEYNMTALHYACQYGASADVIRVLLEHFPGAASFQDDLGLLPLHLACAQGATLQVVQTLLHANPNATSIKDSKGYTPVVYAKACAHPHSKFILKLLNDSTETL